jgi:nucleoporin POM152
LSDAKYSQIKMELPPIEQTVHPLANVELLGQRKRKMFACSGNIVELQVDAKVRPSFK